MKGWITWAAAAGFVLLGVVDIANGEIEPGAQKIVYGVGLVGLGRKIEKNRPQAVEVGNAG